MSRNNGQPENGQNHPSGTAETWKQVAGEAAVSSLSLQIVRHEGPAPTIDSETERDTTPKLTQDRDRRDRDRIAWRRRPFATQGRIPVKG